VLPGGLSHDIRRMAPFTVYADRAAGSRKWDVDGHELIDHVMGHGSLLLGHDHSAIVEAIAGKQVRDVIYMPGRLVNIVTSG